MLKHPKSPIPLHFFSYFSCCLPQSTVVNGTSHYVKSVQSEQLIQYLQAVPNCHCQKEQSCSQRWLHKTQACLTPAAEPEQNPSSFRALAFAARLWYPAPSQLAWGLHQAASGPCLKGREWGRQESTTLLQGLKLCQITLTTIWAGDVAANRGTKVSVQQRHPG